MNNNLLILILGAPGSGKGTQASLLASHTGMFHLEASKAIQDKFKNSSKGDILEIGGEEFSLDKQKERWKDGLLCDDGFVAQVIKEKLEQVRNTGKGVIIDGYPRSVEQITYLMDFIKSSYGVSNVLCCVINVTEEESLQRNSNRRVCSLMRHSIISHPETENLTICPLDGSPLLKRELDNPETIKIRLKEFAEFSLPVVDYLKKSGIEVKEINGRGSVSEVFSRILNLMEEF